MADRLIAYRRSSGARGHAAKSRQFVGAALVGIDTECGFHMSFPEKVALDVVPVEDRCRRCWRAASEGSPP